MPVPSLQVADYHAPPRPVVGVVSERLHRLAAPSLVLRYPPVVRRELREVAYERLDEVPPPPYGVHVPPRDEYRLVALADAVPVLRVPDGPVGRLEVRPEEVRLQRPVLAPEALADRLLAVAIPPDVRPGVGRAERSLPHDLVAMDPDAVGPARCII